MLDADAEVPWKNELDALLEATIDILELLVRMQMCDGLCIKGHCAVYYHCVMTHLILFVTHVSQRTNLYSSAWVFTAFANSAFYNHFTSFYVGDEPSNGTL